MILIRSFLFKNQSPQCKSPQHKLPKNQLLKNGLLFCSLLITPMMGMASIAPAVPQHWELSPQNTKVGFEVNYLGNARAVGQFKKVAGTLHYDTQNPKDLTVHFDVYTDSVDTNWSSRDSLLRGKKFFNSSAHPLMTFEATKVDFTDKKTGSVTGDLTLLGTTKPLTLAVELKEIETNAATEEPVIGFTASGVIDRDAYGMTAFANVIENQVPIKIDGELSYVKLY